MTITEALNIPKGMDFEEYEKLLKDKQKLDTSWAAILNPILFCLLNGTDM